MSLSPLWTLEDDFASNLACAICAQPALKVVHLPQYPDFVVCQACESGFVVEEGGSWVMYGKITLDLPETKAFALKQWTWLEAVSQQASEERESLKTVSVDEEVAAPEEMIEEEEIPSPEVPPEIPEDELFEEVEAEPAEADILAPAPEEAVEAPPEQPPEPTPKEPPEPSIEGEIPDFAGLTEEQLRDLEQPVSEVKEETPPPIPPFEEDIPEFTVEETQPDVPPFKADIPEKTEEEAMEDLIEGELPEFKIEEEAEPPSEEAAPEKELPPFEIGEAEVGALPLEEEAPEPLEGELEEFPEEEALEPTAEPLPEAYFPDDAGQEPAAKPILGVPPQLERVERELVGEPELGERYRVVVRSEQVKFPKNVCAHCLRTPVTLGATVQGTLPDPDQPQGRKPLTIRLPLCKSCRQRADARSDGEKRARIQAHLISGTITIVLVLVAWALLWSRISPQPLIGAATLFALAVLGYAIPLLILLPRAERFPPPKDAAFILTTLRVSEDAGEDETVFEWRNRGYAELFRQVNRRRAVGAVAAVADSVVLPSEEQAEVAEMTKDPLGEEEEDN